MFTLPHVDRGPSFKERLGETLGAGIGSFADQFAEGMLRRKENRALAEQGIDLEGIINPEIRKAMIGQHLKGETATAQKKQAAMQTLSALDRLEALLGQAGIGKSGQINLFEGARQNRGEFESTIAALLPAFKALFPRGFTEREFERIRSDFLPKVGDTEATIKGKIEGLRNMTQGLIAGKTPSFQSQSSKQKFDLSNPAHKKRRDEILKKSKGNREEAHRILSMEFEE